MWVQRFLCWVIDFLSSFLLLIWRLANITFINNSCSVKQYGRSTNRLFSVFSKEILSLSVEGWTFALIHLCTSLVASLGKAHSRLSRWLPWPCWNEITSSIISEVWTMSTVLTALTSKILCLQRRYQVDSRFWTTFGSSGSIKFHWEMARFRLVFLRKPRVCCCLRDESFQTRIQLKPQFFGEKRALETKKEVFLVLQ